MPKYDVDVQLIGDDGNTGTIMAKVSKALKKAGASQAEINNYRAETLSGDYNNVLATAMRWVNVQ